jgi:ABC-type multidrug transport system fused ATPase/permease subunit
MAFLKKFELGLDLQLLKILTPYLSRSTALIVLSISLIILSDFCVTIMPLVIQKGIDVDVAGKDLAGLMDRTIFLGGLLLVSFVGRVISSYIIAWLGQKMLFAMRVDLYEKVLRLPRSFFDRSSTGTVLTHVTNDVESVRKFISEGVVGVLSSLAKLLFIVCAMAYLSPWLAMVTFFSVPLFAVITLWFKRSIRDGFRAVRSANSDINTRMVESLGGHREITLFGHTKSNEERLDVSNRAYLEAYRDIIHAYAVYLPTIENITHFSTLVVLFLTHFGGGDMLRPGDIFAFFTLINMFFRPLREMAEQFNTFQGAMAAVERIKLLQDEPEKIKAPENPNQLSGATPSIRFEGVHFAYQPEKPVLRGLDLNFEPGETVALVGNTGAGKSTIIHLINRVYDIDEGGLFVDGSPISQLDPRELRGSIATIPQDVFLLDGTLSENISLFDPSISKEEIDQAVSYLGLQEFVGSLGQGMDSRIGEGDAQLSQGQKQLVAFCRAWVKQPKVLILDEATASVDSRTEHQLEHALKVLREGRTTIVIAHRLSTIQNADRICVLRHGKVHEQGSHGELIRQGGLYHKLYQRQALSLQVSGLK